MEETIYLFYVLASLAQGGVIEVGAYSEGLSLGWGISREKTSSC